MPERLSWTPRSPWAGVLPAGSGQEPIAAGVVVTPRDGLGLAAVMSLRGKADALRARFQALYGLEPPARPVIVHGRGLDLAWAGPEQWLAVSADRADTTPPRARLLPLPARNGLPRKRPGSQR